MTEHKCPLGGATLVAYPAKGIWRCTVNACFAAQGGEDGIAAHGSRPACLSHGNQEYQVPMTPAEIMEALGQEKLL